MSNELTTDYLLLGLSLYESKTIDNAKLIYGLVSKHRDIQFDCYCTSCDKNSTFKKKTVPSPPPAPGMSFSSNSHRDGETDQDRYLRLSRGEHSLKFHCQRDNKHVYSFHFRVDDNKIMKIGQYPSIADLELHKIQKYRSLLKDDYKDFSKAIGLYSHGIGAGSYVYLRRIFENLIVEQKDIAFQTDASLVADEFERKRMDEKIQYIKDFLPNPLVENRQIYGILSKGIHELSEDDCLSMFPSLELGIEIILDWKLAEKEKQEKENRLKTFVSNAAKILK